GGFVAGKREYVAWVRQKARPYLSSTSLAPAGAAAGLEAIKVVREEPKLREDLTANVRALREGLALAGMRALDSDHPAVAVMIGHAVTAQRVADLLNRKGIFAIGFCH